MSFVLDEITRIKRMQKPTGMVDVILDTDTYNEIDDQFALSYLVRSEEKLRLQAVYVAPFYNHHSTGAGDGMEKSYHEILKLLKKEEYWLRGKNELCDYLVDNTIHEAELMEEEKCWSRVIWDVTAAAWLLDESFIEVEEKTVYD